MAEWLKAHDSKSCGQKCLGGSNPLASAISKIYKHICVFWKCMEASREILENFPSIFLVEKYRILLDARHCASRYV